MLLMWDISRLCLCWVPEHSLPVLMLTVQFAATPPGASHGPAHQAEIVRLVIIECRELALEGGQFSGYGSAL